MNQANLKVLEIQDFRGRLIVGKGFTIDSYQWMEGRWHQDNEANHLLKPLHWRANFKIKKMTKGDIVTIFFINISEDRDQPRAIGEIISASPSIHLYILFVSLSWVKLQEEGTFNEFMDPERS